MPGRNSYDWKRIVADARARDGAWFLPPELIGVPVRVAQGIKLLRHPDLIQEDGQLQATLVDPWRDQNGRKVANIYVRFVRYRE